MNLIDGAIIPHARAQLLFTGEDAAYPDGPMDAQILCIYIGGPDALHVWTPEMANHYYQQNTRLVFLPYYVDSNNGRNGDGRLVYGTPEASALAAVENAKYFGFAANMPGDQRRWIIVDAETNEDYEWYARMANVIWDEGFRMGQYRSLSTQGPVPNAVLIAADWTNVRPASIPWIGQQYEAGPVWDKNVFTEAVLSGCGIGPRG